MQRPAFFPTVKAFRSGIALLAIAMGVGGGILGARAIEQWQDSRIEKRLQLNAPPAIELLAQRLEAYNEILIVLAQQLGDAKGLDQSAFSEYSQALLSQSHLKGLQALSFTRAIPEEKRADLDSNAPAFEVAYVWPLAGNESMLGSNARQPVPAYQSLIKAWSSHQVTVSAPFRFLQLPGAPDDIIMRVPFRFVGNSDGVEKQRWGAVNAQISLGDLIEGLIPAEFSRDIALRLVDLSLSQPSRLSVIEASANTAAIASKGSTLSLAADSLWHELERVNGSNLLPLVEKQLPVHDRLWALQFKPAFHSQTALERWLPWLLCALGLSAGLMLALWMSGWWQKGGGRFVEMNPSVRRRSDARFDALCEQAEMGLLEIDATTRRVLKANAYLCKLIGYKVHEICGLGIMDLLSPDDQIHCAQLLSGLDLKHFQLGVAELCLRTPKGISVWVELHSFLQESEGEQRLLILVQEIAGRKQLERSVRLKHLELRSLMHKLPMGFAMEEKGRFIYWNEEFLRLAGLGCESVLTAEQWWGLMFPDPVEREAVVQRWESARVQAFQAEETQCWEIPWTEAFEPTGLLFDSSGCRVAPQPMMLTGQDGVRRLVTVSAVLQGHSCLMVFQDQSERMAAEQEARRLAFYDAMTGLPNRRLLTDRLQQVLIVAQRESSLGGVVLIDIDNFKAFNETYGLEQGDLLLQTLSQRIVALLPAGATVARLGGDDFVLLFDDLGMDPVTAAARLEQEAAQWLTCLSEPVVIGLVEHSVTVSMGLSLFGEKGLDAKEVLRRAEIAMYQAKNQGRNVCCFFDPLLQSALQERRRMEKDMLAGLQAGEFELFYQPQVENGRVIGAEGLLRWKHPQRGFVSPGEFIPLAEETGAILPLGTWVLEQACRQLAQWATHPRYAQLVLSVNVSPRQFHQGSFVEGVLKALAAHDADARFLKLELTEGMLVSDVDDTIAKMARLKSYGIGFSLDDFGTGYSSLSYLKRLPLDQLKIDRGFVRDVLTDPNDAAIARTIVALAKSLGLHVLAEGVETQEQSRFLESIRCYAWQGFLMSPPVPLHEFEALVMAGNVPGSRSPSLSPVSMR